MISFFKTIIYTPLYNLLAFFVGVLPGHSLGLSIIFLTVFVRALLYPLNKKALQSQVKMKHVAPLLQKIKEEEKDQKIVAEKTLALYKEHGINPFSGCLPMLLQLPIIISLYYVFLKELSFDGVLYPFIAAPETVQAMFFGIDMYTVNPILAILAGASQLAHAHMSQATKQSDTSGSDMQMAIQKSMRVQVLYILPIIIVIFAWKLPSAIALYWVINNIVSIVQEKIVFRK